MRKTLLALAVVLILAPMASAQQAGGPSPHSVDFEACYWAASIVGVNQNLGVPLEDVPGVNLPVDVEPVVLSLRSPTGAPFVIRATYEYKRELGVGLQYYQVSSSGEISEDTLDGNTVMGEDGRVIEGKRNIRLSALDIYHLQSIAKTSESEYNLIGGWRFANWSLNGESEYTALGANPDKENYEETIASKIGGPHIGITGKRRFLIDPLFVTARLSISVLHDNTTATQEEVVTVGLTGEKTTLADVTCTDIQSPVDVDEAEIALRFESPRMAGMGGKIGYLASNWENMPVACCSIPIRGKIGFCGWVAGINFKF